MAFFTPVHGITGCGAFHRSSPTGGAANGMPLKMERSPSTAPSTSPPVTIAVGMLPKAEENKVSVIAKAVGAVGKERKAGFMVSTRAKNEVGTLGANDRWLARRLRGLSLHSPLATR